MVLKGCKWSSLNAPGTETPQSHPYWERGNQICISMRAGFPLPSYLEASKYTGPPWTASTTRWSASKEVRIAASSFLALFVSLRNCFTEDSIMSILLFISWIVEEASLSWLPNSPTLFRPSSTCGIKLLEVSCSFSTCESEFWSTQKQTLRHRCTIHLCQVFKDSPNGLGLIVDCRPNLHGRVVHLGNVCVDSVGTFENLWKLSVDKAKEG